MKTPMSTETKLTRDEEGESVDNTKYRGLIEITLIAKSTSGVLHIPYGMLFNILVFKKQTALAISTTEAEYVSTGKACQQALWMKQALIHYGIRLDNIPIMCDTKRL
ncbi:hypothetical protein Tco_0026497 [Tanacetum coccineum]